MKEFNRIAKVSNAAQSQSNKKILKIKYFKILHLKKILKISIKNQKTKMKLKN